MESEYRKIPLSIISGFLGAGKTTFIRKLVKEVFSREKVVVLENEFGRIDLDSANLSRERILVESIKGGCICCSCSGILAQSVQEIISKHHPDRIIIEPTGLALLTDVLEALREPQIKEICDFSHIVTIVDAGNFHKRISISKVFFENQISSSRVIFLSKTENLRQDQITDVKAQIHAVNPFCEIIENAWDQIPAETMKAALAFSAYTDTVSTRTDSTCTDTSMPDSDYTACTDTCEKFPVQEPENFSADTFQNFSYESYTYIPSDNIRRLFDGFGKNEYGEIYRAKGIFRNTAQEWFTCEYVPGEVRFYPLMQEMPPGETTLRICVIGIRINSGKMRSTLLNSTKT